MNGKIRNKLLIQGFCKCDLENDPKISSKARWTPLSCAGIGSIGLLMGNTPFILAVCPCVATGLLGLFFGQGLFFMILGLLTITGGFTVRSIYDRLYNITLKYLFRSSAIPPHGAPRQFGCAIGGIMYFLAGIGFYIHNLWLAYIPALFMITFALIAGITQWCFASSLYHLLSKGKN